MWRHLVKTTFSVLLDSIGCRRNEYRVFETECAQYLKSLSGRASHQEVSRFSASQQYSLLSSLEHRWRPQVSTMNRISEAGRLDLDYLLALGHLLKTHPLPTGYYLLTRNPCHQPAKKENISAKNCRHGDLCSKCSQNIP